jgi:hypothetical protein
MRQNPPTPLRPSGSRSAFGRYSLARSVDGRGSGVLAGSGLEWGGFDASDKLESVMMRSCVAAVGVLVVCGSVLAQVAAPPDKAAPAQPEKPVPIARPRPERPQAVAPSEVRVPKPVVEAAGTGEKVDLHPKWTTGDTARYDFEFLSRWTSHLGEDEKAKKGGQLYRQEGRLVRRVASVDDSGVTLAITMERLHIQVSSGTEVVHYDSDFGDKPDRQNELTAPVQACVGRQITVKLNRAGEVVSVVGNENPAPDPSNPDAKQTQIPQAILGTQVVRKLWRPLYQLDKKNLDSRVGDKWSTTEVTTDPGLGTFELTFSHSLGEMKDGVAKITSTADVMLTPAIGHGVITATLTDSTIKGIVEWNTSTGTLKSWETNQDMKLDAERSGEKQKLDTQLKTILKWVDPNAPKELNQNPASTPIGEPVKDATKDGAKDVPKPAPAAPAKP